MNSKSPIEQARENALEEYELHWSHYNLQELRRHHDREVEEADYNALYVREYYKVLFDLKEKESK